MAATPCSPARRRRMILNKKVIKAVDSSVTISEDPLNAAFAFLRIKSAAGEAEFFFCEQEEHYTCYSRDALTDAGRQSGSCDPHVHGCDEDVVQSGVGTSGDDHQTKPHAGVSRCYEVGLKQGAEGCRPVRMP